jgi:tRNA1(Val) A37 N6-methylase TrmN6
MNTFEEDFYDVDDYNKPVKVDFIFTNPPYGNSGSSTMEDKLRIDTAGSIIK